MFFIIKAILTSHFRGEVRKINKICIAELLFIKTHSTVDGKRSFLARNIALLVQKNKSS